jgi:drug/metabolite transporter (DMT)-like permease
MILALLAVTGHFCVTAAFAKAQASVLSPFEYTALFWAILYDWLLWQGTPNPQTMIGGCIVITAGLYFVYRERLSNKNN